MVGFRGDLTIETIMNTSGYPNFLALDRNTMRRATVAKASVVKTHIRATRNGPRLGALWARSATRDLAMVARVDIAEMDDFSDTQRHHELINRQLASEPREVGLARPPGKVKVHFPRRMGVSRLPFRCRINILAGLRIT